MDEINADVVVRAVMTNVNMTAAMAVMVAIAAAKEYEKHSFDAFVDQFGACGRRSLEWLEQKPE